MALPPPLPDPAHVETRLIVVAEMLVRAVDEVNRVLAEIKGDVPPAGGELTTQGAPNQPIAKNRTIPSRSTNGDR